MLPGDRVRVRTEDKTEKVWGRVVDVVRETEPVEVTLGPDAARLGLRPDTYRRFVPGRTSVRVVIELEL